jgi:hypothetical protein
MSVYNIFDMASGEEVGRFFARTAGEALNAMAKTAGFETYEEALCSLPAMADNLLVTEL